MLAVELDRVEADVHQHLHTVWARDTDRVLRVEHRRHSARDGGDELAVSRADSDPLAEDLSREDGIVDLGERDDLTGEGALQLDAGGGGLCRVARVGDRTGEAKRSGGRVTPENERGDKRHTEGDDDADEGVDDVHRVLGVHEHRDAREARTDGDEGAHVCEAHVGTGAKGTHDDGDERPPVLQRDAVESRLGDAEKRGDAGRERGRAEALVLGAERDAKGGARLREVVREGCSEVQRLAAGVGDCRDRRGRSALCMPTAMMKGSTPARSATATQPKVWCRPMMAVVRSDPSPKPSGPMASMEIGTTMKKHMSGTKKTRIGPGVMRLKRRSTPQSRITVRIAGNTCAA